MCYGPRHELSKGFSRDPFILTSLPEHIRVIPDYSFNQKCLYLRRSGYNNSEIAGMLDVSKEKVKSVIDRAIKSSLDEQRISVIREEEIGKLDQLEAAFMPLAVGIDTEEGQLPPDKDSADVVLKVMDRRMKLLGTEKKPDQNINLNQLTLVQVLSDMPKVAHRTIEGDADAA